MDPEATAAMDSKESKTVPKDSTDAPADDRKNESDADRARRELQIGEELTPERKIAFSRSFTLPHSAQVRSPCGPARPRAALAGFPCPFPRA